jgi:hypothetical protein
VIDIVSVIDDDELLKITTTSPAANVEFGTVCPALTDNTLPTSPTTSVFVELLDTGTFLYPTGLVPSTVQLLSVPDVGVPKIGVTKVGVLANTLAPVPVSSVSAAAKLADEGVARNVATLAANPEIPVLTGKPVQFVNVPDDGVPSAPPELRPVANDKLPEPSVLTNCPAVPSVPGSVKVVLEEVFAD